MNPVTKHILKTWGIAIGLAVLITFAFQLPLCTVPFISDFFEHLKKEHAFQLLSAIFILPSYVVFFWRLKTTKQRLLNITGFTVFLGVLLPVLWVFGFYTSRMLFDGCM
jgi:hypothetical protein